MQVRIETMDEQWAVCVSHRGPYQQVGEAFRRLQAWAEEAGLMAGEPRFFGLSHDDPDIIPAAELRYEACLAVDGPWDVPAPFQVRRIAGGRYGFHGFQGHYDGIEETFRRLFGEWLPGAGGVADGSGGAVAVNPPAGRGTSSGSGHHRFQL